MNKEQEIILLFKRNSFRFYYSQHQNEFRLYDYDGIDIPLYFYSDETSFKVGNVSKQKYYSKLSNTYGNFFELLKDLDGSFNYFGEKEPYKNLIIKAIEEVLIEFYKGILFSNIKLEEIREKTNINLVFHNEINENECDFISNLFEESEFRNVCAFTYNYLVLNALNKFNPRFGTGYRGYICADKSGNNLNLSFFENLQSKRYKSIRIGKDLAISKEVLVIAGILAKKARSEGSRLTQDEAIQEVIGIAEIIKKKLENEYIVREKVKLSDLPFPVGPVAIQKRNILSILEKNPESSQDVNFLEAFISTTHLQQSDIKIVLNKSIENRNFIDNVRAKFAHDYSVDLEFEEILELFNKHPDIIQKGNLIGGGNKTNISTQTSSRNVTKSMNNTTSAPPPPPPPMTSTRTRDRSKKSSLNVPKTPVKVSGSVPPPPPPLMTNTKTRSRSKIPSTEAPKTVKKTNNPPPLPSAKKKSSPPPLPSAKKKSGPPPLPSAKKKSGPPPLPNAKKKSGPPPLPKKR